MSQILLPHRRDASELYPEAVPGKTPGPTADRVGQPPIISTNQQSVVWLKRWLMTAFSVQYCLTVPSRLNSLFYV